MEVPIFKQFCLQPELHILSDLREIHLRKKRWVKDGFDRPGIDGQDGNYNASQKQGCKFVDVFHTDKNHHSHKGEEQGAVHTHVVQRGAGGVVGSSGMENGSLGGDVGLKESKG